MSREKLLTLPAVRYALFTLDLLNLWMKASYFELHHPRRYPWPCLRTGSCEPLRCGSDGPPDRGLLSRPCWWPSHLRGPVLNFDKVLTFWHGFGGKQDEFKVCSVHTHIAFLELSSILLPVFGLYIIVMLCHFVVDLHC